MPGSGHSQRPPEGAKKKKKKTFVNGQFIKKYNIFIIIFYYITNPYIWFDSDVVKNI